MMSFKSILLYAGGEGSPRPAIARAAALASCHGARLTLVDVLPEGPASPWTSLPGRGRFERTPVVARRDRLEELAVPLREQGLEVVTRVLTGRPFVELIHEAQCRSHDLVMQTAQGPGGGLGGLPSSTAMHLLRKCPCPVWVVKPNQAAGRGVLAAIGPDLESPGDDRQSRTIVELASSLARIRGVELHVVHAWRPWPESVLRSPRLSMPSEQVDALVEESRRAAESAVREVMETVNLFGISVRLHLVQGTPFEVISRISGLADVAVMGTRSRAGVAGVLIGNTAERVLNRLACSVIAVKPEGFVTPLRLPSDALDKIA